MVQNIAIFLFQQFDLKLGEFLDVFEILLG
jgi:hypothetical protein